MDDIISLHMRGVRAWFDALETGAAVWTTLAHRMPMIAMGGMSATEGRLMVSEKIEAAAQATLDASSAVAKFAARAARSHHSPSALALAALTIGEAAALPISRRVKANARRLSRR